MDRGIWGSTVHRVAKSWTGLKLLGMHRDQGVASQVVLMVTQLPIQETWVPSLGWEDPLEEGLATTPGFLPEESHKQRSLARYSPWSCRVEHN